MLNLRKLPLQATCNIYPLIPILHDGDMPKNKIKE